MQLMVWSAHWCVSLRSSALIVFKCHFTDEGTMSYPTKSELELKRVCQGWRRAAQDWLAISWSFPRYIVSYTESWNLVTLQLFVRSSCQECWAIQYVVRLGNYVPQPSCEDFFVIHQTQHALFLFRCWPHGFGNCVWRAVWSHIPRQQAPTCNQLVSAHFCMGYEIDLTVVPCSPCQIRNVTFKTKSIIINKNTSAWPKWKSSNNSPFYKFHPKRTEPTNLEDDQNNESMRPCIVSQWARFVFSK